jgi:hypothetical protein
MGEREPQSERLRRGELLCLYHPGTHSIFSGYGLVMGDDWPGHLTGLLMVDRPFLADPAWLERIHNTYGECELRPMTIDGLRGLVCQMFIEPDSIQHLRHFMPDFSQHLENALQPLLEEPPAPTLVLRWHEERRLWMSELIVRNGLPPAIQEVFERIGYGCLAAESDRGVVHVCYAADDDISTFVDKDIEARWDMIEMPTAPLVRLELLVYDDPVNPYCFESFLNVAAPDQLDVLVQLAKQEELYMAFYGDDLTYRYTSVLVHGEDQRQRLDEIISRAKAYSASLPPGERDFDRAKALYMRIHP